ncbi:eclosion hormone [Phlebotomus papatasi]|uniref:eclosion hormone n=1 Tax=Phlebotomus papatasi TaxID=29031 RepID=UPI002483FF4D|nr:eclosion hormone [Phlebotomus papatasi]
MNEKRFLFLLTLGVFVAVLSEQIFATPTIGKKYDVMGSYDFIGVCIRNCAQCKKMFGSYFEGQMCADACVKFKGKIIPDCEDIGSIAPFLTKLD